MTIILPSITRLPWILFFFTIQLYTQLSLHEWFPIVCKLTSITVEFHQLKNETNAICLAFNRRLTEMPYLTLCLHLFDAFYDIFFLRHKSSSWRNPDFFLHYFKCFMAFDECLNVAKMAFLRSGLIYNIIFFFQHANSVFLYESAFFF